MPPWMLLPQHHQYHQLKQRQKQQQQQQDSNNNKQQDSNDNKNLPLKQPRHAGPAPLATSLEQIPAKCVLNAHGLRCVATTSAVNCTNTSVAGDPTPCICANSIIFSLIAQAQAEAKALFLCLSTRNIPHL
jgi:hypothetical protein